jgi:uroporphyrinogen decarboxylase
MIPGNVTIFSTAPKDVAFWRSSRQSEKASPGVVVTSKERVITALSRRALPDRPPLQFDLSRRQIERFSKVYRLEPDFSPSYYEDLTYRISANELRTRMGSDCVVVGTESAAGYTAVRGPDGSYTNEFGMVMRQGPIYVDVVGHPLGNLSSAAQVERFRFPDPHDPRRYVLAERDIAKFREDYFVIGDCEVTIFALARQLMGMEHCLVSLLEEEEYMEPLLQECSDWSKGVAGELVSRGVDAIWFGDDFGTQESLIMSPELFRERFMLLYADLIARVKDQRPQLIVIFHSDGAVAPLLDDFIEIGVDVFNPVQPGVPGHDPGTLKKRFGERLSFFGAIDQQRLLPRGSPKEIRRDVREKIETLGEGGGYMVAPAHIIQSDTPKENVEALISGVLEYRY